MLRTTQLLAPILLQDSSQAFLALSISRIKHFSHQAFLASSISHLAFLASSIWNGCQLQARHSTPHCSHGHAWELARSGITSSKLRNGPLSPQTHHQACAFFTHLRNGPQFPQAHHRARIFKRTAHDTWVAGIASNGVHVRTVCILGLYRVLDKHADGGPEAVSDARALLASAAIVMCLKLPVITDTLWHLHNQGARGQAERRQKPTSCLLLH